MTRWKCNLRRLDLTGKSKKNKKKNKGYTGFWQYNQSIMCLCPSKKSHHSFTYTLIFISPCQRLYSFLPAEWQYVPLLKCDRKIHQSIIQTAEFSCSSLLLLHASCNKLSFCAIPKVPSIESNWKNCICDTIRGWHFTTISVLTNSLTIEKIL